MHLTENMFNGYKKQKQNSNGYIPKPISLDDCELPKEIADAADKIAKNTHENWSKNKMENGYTFGKVTNDAKKTHCDLIPYEKLSDEKKRYDIETSTSAIKLLIKLGYKIIPPDKRKHNIDEIITLSLNKIINEEKFKNLSDEIGTDVYDNNDDNVNKRIGKYVISFINQHVERELALSQIEDRIGPEKSMDLTRELHNIHIKLVKCIYCYLFQWDIGNNISPKQKMLAFNLASKLVTLTKEHRYIDSIYVTLDDEDILADNIEIVFKDGFSYVFKYDKFNGQDAYPKNNDGFFFKKTVFFRWDDDSKHGYLGDPSFKEEYRDRKSEELIKKHGKKPIYVNDSTYHSCKWILTVDSPKWNGLDKKYKVEVQ